MLRLCHEFHWALYELRFVFQNIVPILAGVDKPDDIWRVLKKVNSGLHMAMCAYFNRPRKEESAIPKWMLQAITLGENPVIPQNHTPDSIMGHEAAKWKYLEEFIVADAKAEREQIEKQNTEKQNNL
jgi:hypothetical protein